MLFRSYAVVCLLLWQHSVGYSADPPPNIVLILADDMGYGDVGFNGCQDIPTPNIDSLAAKGVRFANGYSSHPFCSPMRAGLMAGRYQQRFGYVANVAFDPHNQLLGLPVSEKTIASRLRDAGYRTGMVGKWHLGAAAPFHPMNRGFDFFYGFLGGGHDYFQVGTTVQLDENYKAALDDNGKPVAFDGYLTTALTDQAIRFINESDQKPYFIYVAYNAPHGPLQAPEDEIAKFASIEDPSRQIYAAMVSIMDQQIGRLLQTIDDRAERENTLVAFLSDNGGPETKNGSDNGPLRGAKGDVFEGGIHVPFVMRMPGTLPAGMVYHHPVISFDITQTALDLGVAIDAKNGDAVNLFPYLLGESETPPHEAIYWLTRNHAKRAVRRGNDKLILQGKETMLFDLDADLEESISIAPSETERFQELRGLYEEWDRANLPLFFQHAPAYHKLLKELQLQVQKDAQANDTTKAQ